MSLSFYSSAEYKNKQSLITKKNWERGKYNSLIRPPEKRFCKNPDCNRYFFARHGDPKIYCSHSCSAHIGNIGRKQSLLTRLRISQSILSLPPERRPHPKIKPRIKLICAACKKQFWVIPYLSKRRKYCSPICAITTIGKRTTSPKASKGKPGIRKDIDPNICFYSTWEANTARVFNLVNLRWQYAPRIFNLGKHTYRPDFYLPDFDTFIEVKNFLGPYSLQRDRLFRRKYPNIKLDLILKKHYLEIKLNYKDLVDIWEY